MKSQFFFNNVKIRKTTILIISFKNLKNTRLTRHGLNVILQLNVVERLWMKCFHVVHQVSVVDVLLCPPRNSLQRVVECGGLDKVQVGRVPLHRCHQHVDESGVQFSEKLRTNSTNRAIYKFVNLKRVRNPDYNLYKFKTSHPPVGHAADAPQSI